MNLGIKLKELRKAADFTQEELAETLGVSFQTISKWENNVSLPDISMLPIIADCFHVSIDELLCYNSAQREEEIASISKAAHAKKDAGNLREAYDFLCKEIENYPSSIKLNSLLAATAYMLSKELETKEKIFVLQKAIHRAEIVIKLDNGNTSRTAQAKMCIAYCLRDLGLQEQAEEIATNMPSMFSSREVMLFRILSGEKKRAQAQQNLEYLKELEEEMKEFISQ